jgi:hypothetical protein
MQVPPEGVQYVMPAVPGTPPRAQWTPSLSPVQVQNIPTSYIANRFVGQIPELVALVLVGMLMHEGRLEATVGIPTILAVLAGRLMPQRSPNVGP